MSNRNIAKLAVGTLLAVAGLSAAPAWAKKSCDELKSEIDAKLVAKGVTRYTLEIVPAAQVEDSAKTVGTCDGGAQKIVYQRGKS